MREVEILKKKQLKCYLYTRVSTSMQVDGYSLDAQRDKLRKYAAYEDMIVAGEYSDEGFSGKNIQGRQDFQRMLNDIQDGKDDVSYVLVFKLSRFGRNAADVLNSLQLMQDFGVNLICVEDGIDSSKDAGKLMISVLSAVAEIERENIRTQTMAGREQKAREGKWNGGFAPYGYKLEDGNLVIAEDEVEVIRVIYDRYIHTNEGVAGVAKYLNRNGYVKKLRQNNTIPGFSRDFVKNVLYNPVYMGKIAYGRRRTEKKQGTRNEMHVVEQSEFPVYEGQHEAIISEEDWYLAQEKRKINSFKREKVNNPDHAHILSGILKCPCCGKSMYGNIAKAHSKDKKTRRIYPMKFFKKNENKKTTKLPMTGKVKKSFRYYCMAVMAMTFVLGTSVTAFAANDPIQVVNNLSDFIFGLVRAVGMIMLGFGIVQIGLSLKSHDPSQRANGFLTLAGGVVITFAKEILTLITG